MANGQNSKNNVAGRKKTPKKRNSGANRYTAREILALIRAEPGPVPWSTLTHLAGADKPKTITQLRQMLKGLQRSGELQRNQHGDYQLPDGGVPRKAVARLRGRMLVVDDLPIDDAGRLNLRAGDEIEYRISEGRAQVIQVTQLSEALFTGIFSKQGRDQFVNGLGQDRGRIRILQSAKKAREGDTVQVSITARDERGLSGNIVHILESENVLDQAIQTAVTGGGLPFEWPAEVTTAVSKLPTRVVPGRYPQREDLTGLPLVTIDGETARDFDDAVFAEPLKRRAGGFRLVVAIADVGHYVKPRTPLDDEAVLRSTSVYFPERVIPMLPEALSNGLCSLRPETPRLALVCEMFIDVKGNIFKHQFSEAVIFSHARLTYNQVQAYLDTGAKMPVNKSALAAVNQSVDALAQLHDVMREARTRRGALEFETHEANIEIKDGRVAAITPVGRLVAHQLIEEAMIAANVSAAVFLEEAQVPALYRVHETPDPDKVAEFSQALGQVGVKLPSGEITPLVLQSALNRLPDYADPWLYGQMALRTLKQALYSPENQGHFGLALDRYMHFTSPIRRYPDLVVHRAIKSVLAKRAGRKSKNVPGMDELQQLGEICSSNERRAENAGWMVDAWLKCDFLRDRAGETFAGVIASVTEFGLFVDLDTYYVQGLLHISNLGSDYFNFDPRAFALIGERSGRKFRLGDRLQVVVEDIDPPQGRIDLSLPGMNNTRTKKSAGPPGGKKKSSSGRRKKRS
ncbi:MAG: ribonuclease R [Pseudomonadaceae bacterium]|nr:ribonuclease R [Pseudomonadaceae bacterium]